MLPRRQEEGTGELFVAREIVEEARAAAEKMPGLLVGEVDMQNTDLILRYRGVAKAVLRNVEFYEHRKVEMCANARQFVTIKLNHPYIKHVMASMDWLVGGELDVLAPDMGGKDKECLVFF